MLVLITAVLLFENGDQADFVTVITVSTAGEYDLLHPTA